MEEKMDNNMSISEQPLVPPAKPGEEGRTREDSADAEDLNSARGIMSINDYVAGAIAGSAGIMVGHPFDTAKVQMQIRTSGEHRIGKTSEALSSVSAQGLRRGLFRGMMFPVMSYGAVNSLFFGVYGNTIKLLEPDENIQPSSSKVYISGCVAGTVQLILACPTEVIKCTLQSQIPLTRKTQPEAANLLTKPVMPKIYHSGPVACAIEIMRTEGVKGFYKGYFAMFLRDVPSYGLYLLVYEHMFAYMVKHDWTDKHHVIAAIVAGGLAGSASWGSIMPLDVIKSRLQVDHGNRFNGFIDCAVQSVQRAGFSVLFRGTGITMARAFPVNAVTFLFYSQLLKYLDRVNPR